MSLETTKEFTGSGAGLILGILFCFPLAILYYFSNKEELWICPDCQDNIPTGASVCKHCSADLEQYTNDE
ncbi:MAG: hypothetical protein J07HN4v3_02212 [Halonotius sp. J07HN4]|nr:MAG: hypothetical protein J07HN4v3_02212 [Halonotius sp. J07HN4]